MAACRVVGGHGLAVRPGQTWDVVFSESGLSFRQGSDQGGAIPYEEITALEIGGPGETRQGGGFIGGGSGLAGAAEGMLISAALNMLTTRTRINTVICLQTPSAELFLHNSTEPPNAMRMRLSPVFSKLRQQHAASASASASAPAAQPSEESVVDRLAKLADLLDRGLLSMEEFAKLKADLLA